MTLVLLTISTYKITVLFNIWYYLLWETEEEQRTFINLLSKISVGRGGVGAGVGAGSVVLSSSRPAPYVPEDLVAQAQSVLQGILGYSMFGNISSPQAPDFRGLTSPVIVLF